MDSISLKPEELKMVVDIAAYAAVKLGQDEKKLIHGIKGLAEFLGVRRETAQRYRSRGLVPSMKVGGRVLFDKDEVMRSLKKMVNG